MAIVKADVQRKWQKSVTVPLGTSVVVELPSGVGSVQVSLDWSGSGTGSAKQSIYTSNDAVANTDATQWVDLAATFTTKGANFTSTTSAYSTAVLLTAATANQRFVLLGQNHA
jgi:hypothetical protein